MQVEHALTQMGGERAFDAAPDAFEVHPGLLFAVEDDGVGVFGQEGGVLGADGADRHALEFPEAITYPEICPAGDEVFWVVYGDFVVNKEPAVGVTVRAADGGPSPPAGLLLGLVAGDSFLLEHLLARQAAELPH